jgi:hypothetical protein
MANLLPAKTTSFVASPDGTVTPYALVKATQSLSREERIDAYRKGLRDTEQLLVAKGFSVIYSCEHSYSLSYQGLILDFRIQRPSLVAHVAGNGVAQAGDQIGSYGGTVFKLSDEIKSEFALMITVASTRYSAPPVFVDLDVSNPASTIVDSVVSVIKMLKEKRTASPRLSHVPDVPELD